MREYMHAHTYTHTYRILNLRNSMCNIILNAHKHILGPIRNDFDQFLDAIDSRQIRISIRLMQLLDQVVLPTGELIGVPQEFLLLDLDWEDSQHLGNARV